MSYRRPGTVPLAAITVREVQLSLLQTLFLQLKSLSAKHEVIRSPRDLQYFDTAVSETDGIVATLKQTVQATTRVHQDGSQPHPTVRFESRLHEKPERLARRTRRDAKALITFRTCIRWRHVCHGIHARYAIAWFKSQDSPFSVGLRLLLLCLRLWCPCSRGSSLLNTF